MVKRFLFALAAAAVVSAGVPAFGAPTGWGETATMGWTKYAMVAVNVGHRIYLIGDRDTLHVYDITTNSWSTGKAPPLNQYGPAVALGGKIYLLGGVTGTRATGNCTVYDPTADAWTSIASLPSARGAGAAAVLNGKIHLVGGRAYQGATLVDTNDQQIYDPVANAWHAGVAMPTSRDGLSLVADPSSGKLYAIGGWNGQSMNPSTANEIYNSATHTWTKGAPMPTGRFSAGAAILKGKIYVLGGSTNNVMYSVVEAYNLSTGAWSQRMSLPAARPLESAVVVNGVLYATGGNVCQGSACYGTDRFWTLTPTP